MRTRIAFVAVVLVFTAVPVLAHHAFTAEFDANQPIQLRGTVARVELINPHSWFHIDVAEEDGTLTRWMIEGGTPNTLFRRGVTRNSLPRRYRDSCRWLSCARWDQQGERARHDVFGWTQDLSGWDIGNGAAAIECRSPECPSPLLLRRLAGRVPERRYRAAPCLPVSGIGHVRVSDDSYPQES